jgi:hypothetical protein
MPTKKRPKSPPKHPRRKESDPHVQKEYREHDREAIDPHRKDEVKPV